MSNVRTTIASEIRLPFCTSAIGASATKGRSLCQVGASVFIRSVPKWCDSHYVAKTYSCKRPFDERHLCARRTGALRAVGDLANSTLHGISGAQSFPDVPHGQLACQYRLHLSFAAQARRQGIRDSGGDPGRQAPRPSSEDQPCGSSKPEVMAARFVILDCRTGRGPHPYAQLRFTDVAPWRSKASHCALEG